jgi:hypothetical protein
VAAECQAERKNPHEKIIRQIFTFIRQKAFQISGGRLF